MFSSFLSAITGQGETEGDSYQTSPSSSKENNSKHSAPSLDLWSVANTVKSTFKSRADEIYKSVVETDWKAELASFKEEVSHDASVVKEKAVKVVESLPEVHIASSNVAEDPLFQGYTFTGENSIPPLPDNVTATLENVGGTIASLSKRFVKNTQELITQVKEAVEEEIGTVTKEQRRAVLRDKPSGSSRASYGRFQAEVAALQRDVATFCDEPEDALVFEDWLYGRIEGVMPFDLSTSATQMLVAAALSGAGGALLTELQNQLVPAALSDEQFWSRYLYRLYKLEQTEARRRQLAATARAINDDDEEEEDMSKEELGEEETVELGEERKKEKEEAGKGEEREDLVWKAVKADGEEKTGAGVEELTPIGNETKEGEEDKSGRASVHSPAGGTGVSLAAKEEAAPLAKGAVVMEERLAEEPTAVGEVKQAAQAAPSEAPAASTAAGAVAVSGALLTSNASGPALVAVDDAVQGNGNGGSPVASESGSFLEVETGSEGSVADPQSAAGAAAKKEHWTVVSPKKSTTLAKGHAELKSAAAEEFTRTATELKAEDAKQNSQSEVKEVSVVKKDEAALESDRLSALTFSPPSPAAARATASGTAVGRAGTHADVHSGGKPEAEAGVAKANEDVPAPEEKETGGEGDDDSFAVFSGGVGGGEHGVPPSTSKVGGEVVGKKAGAVEDDEEEDWGGWD